MRTYTKTLRVYLAGPMTGLPENNFPVFRVAADKLRSIGYDVISPAEMDIESGFDPTRGLEEQGFSRAEVLLKDIEIIARGGVEGIVFLPGSYRSPGARAEFAFGRYMGLRMFRAWVGINTASWFVEEITNQEADMYFNGEG